MSQKNVEVARSAYAAVNEGHLDGLLALIDPDVECHLPAGGISAETLRGRDALRTFLEGYLEAFEYFRCEPERFVEAGDQVLSSCTCAVGDAR
ncbi:MAG: nuclear transport factor 2 family protein [Solirubrobacterales bacterium]|nr:nuclear transport factor 2 family protein [Solirubrobacterales bacterium]